MNTQSQPYRLEQFPVLIRPGHAIGIITDGIADLTVAWDYEQDRAYVERVESITLAVDETDKKDAPLQRERLAEDDPFFAMISAEIMRLDDAGKLDLEFDHDAGLYVGLRAGAR
ncbi:hypothetical protein ACUSIJ_24780 [Pseudochelatococcus sp. B33]